MLCMGSGPRRLLFGIDDYDQERDSDYLFILFINIIKIFVFFKGTNHRRFGIILKEVLSLSEIIVLLSGSIRGG